jgi:hypothetical protein
MRDMGFWEWLRLTATSKRGGYGMLTRGQFWTFVALIFLWSAAQSWSVWQ